MLTIKKQTFLIIISLILFLPNILPLSAGGKLDLNLEYPTLTMGEQSFDLNDNQNLNEISAWFYIFFVTISGVAAFFGLVSGGFVRLTSEGNPTKISDANDRITSALLGLIIILSSYLILKTINPELTTLYLEKLPEIPSL